MPQCQVLIAKPGISVSTRTVYESLDAMDLAPKDHPDIDGMVEAIRRRDLMDVEASSAMCWNWSQERNIPSLPGLRG